MSLLMTIAVGGIVGWLASTLMKTNAQMRILADVIVGVVGAFLGSSIAGTLGISGGGSSGSFIVAVSGAALLVAIRRMAMLLWAPQSGRQTRATIARKLGGTVGSARELKDRALQRGRQLRGEAAHRVGEGGSALSGGDGQLTGTPDNGASV